MDKLRHVTLVLLVRRSGARITQILLAMKKRGFGMGKWNGVGGKFAPVIDKDIEATARRETREEIGVDVPKLVKVAEMGFIFPDKPEWDQLVHVYLADSWQGEPAESEEMAPKWYRIKDIPYEQMWWDDHLWLPHVLKGELVKAEFIFANDEKSLGQKLQVVEKL